MVVLIKFLQLFHYFNVVLIHQSILFLLLLNAVRAL